MAERGRGKRALPSASNRISAGQRCQQSEENYSASLDGASLEHRRRVRTPQHSRTDDFVGASPSEDESSDSAAASQSRGSSSEGAKNAKNEREKCRCAWVRGSCTLTYG